MRTHWSEQGFTLTELMVVVTVLGILTAMAVPVFDNAKAESQRRACFATQRTIEGAAQTYQADQGALPGGGPLNAPGWLIPNFIASVPYCPLGTVATTYYTLDAVGTVTGDQGATPGFAATHRHF
jgi:prepilin-type N-terminal cleavage/methylation domain-containing protein